MAAIALLPLACQTHQAMPLDDKAVANALATPGEDRLRVGAKEIQHPLLKPVILDLSDGLSPDEAAILAVLANPALRAERDRVGVAAAQVLQAGVLPNPQLSGGADFPTNGSTAGTTAAFGVGVNWDVTSLIGRSQRVDGAAAQQARIELEVAWSEWQAAMGARAAVVRLAGFTEQAELAAEAADRLDALAGRLRDAAAAGQATAMDLAAAEAAAVQAQAMLLDLRRQADQQRLSMKRILGLPPDATIRIQGGLALPELVDVPPADRLLAGLEGRRLDLVALRHGYASQEQALHAAVLGQFPRINIGLTHARDTSNVGTTGFGISIDLPIFDRNQGRIAIERATRQQLFDEYAARVADARADLAELADAIRALNAMVAQARSALPALDRLARTYETALARGQADALAAHTAWTNWAQKRIEAAGLRQQLAEAEIALELAAGVYRLEDLPGAPRAEEGR